MDDFLFALKYLVIGFAVGWLWTPISEFAKMFYTGFKEMVHEWNNPKEKND